MLTGVVKKKGATMVYEARGELLVMPGQVIHSWTQRFTNRVQRYTSAAAPTHNYGKRPLRPHPGPHLKTTIIRGRTRPYVRASGGAVFSAVGSTAPYAAFVDQGTKGQIAKVLPPWAPGSPTLFEATWTPRGRGPVGPKPVSGQKARHFFDTGMDRAFAYMLRRSYQVPGERGLLSGGGPSVANLGWDAFFGNTGSDPSFTRRLDTWRQWRTEAYGDKRHQAERERRRAPRSRGMSPGEKARRAQESAERRRAEARKRTQRNRDKAKDTKKAKDITTKSRTRAADRAAFLRAMKAKYRRVDSGSAKYRGGYWYVLVWKDDGTGRATWVEVRGKAKS